MWPCPQRPLCRLRLETSVQIETSGQRIERRYVGSREADIVLTSRDAQASLCDLLEGRCPLGPVCCGSHSLPTSSDAYCCYGAACSVRHGVAGRDPYEDTAPNVDTEEIGKMLLKTLLWGRVCCSWSTAVSSPFSRQSSETLKLALGRTSPFRQGEPSRDSDRTRRYVFAASGGG